MWCNKFWFTAGTELWKGDKNCHLDPVRICICMPCVWNNFSLGIKSSRLYIMKALNIALKLSFSHCL